VWKPAIANSYGHACKGSRSQGIKMRTGGV